MKTFLSIFLFLSMLTQFVWAAEQEHSSQSDSQGTPVFLMANDFSIATGQPSLVQMSNGSTHVPVWSLSGGTPGQSVSGVAAGFSSEYAAVKVEIVVISTDKTTSPEFTDVYRVHLSQLIDHKPFTSRYQLGKPVQTVLPDGPFKVRTIVLNSYFEIVPNAPVTVRIQREPTLPEDTFTRPMGLVAAKLTPLKAHPKGQIVQDVPGYNSWPMIQAIGEKLVCTYSRGSGHTIQEDARGVYARTSSDGGKTWSAETVVAETPGYGEVTVGKGLDSNGAMLLWVRRIGKEWNHDLYRTEDGIHFERIATPQLKVQPMQITDVFHVPEVGLMSLWFAGNYSQDNVHSWGLMTSRDEGKTWEETQIESELFKKDWPTEPAAVYLGDGKILAVGRTETGPSQFQLTSLDYGKTWTRTRTNITDIAASTPSLILDQQTGLLSNYYYERGQGFLRRRVVDPHQIFTQPNRWPDSEIIAIGSLSKWDSGNANATVIGGTHYVSYYSGKAPHTSVFVAAHPAPAAKE